MTFVILLFFTKMTYDTFVLFLFDLIYAHKQNIETVFCNYLNMTKKKKENIL